MKRFSLIAGAVALLALLGATASAQAQLVDRSHEHITDTFEVQICGLNLVSTVDFVTNQQVPAVPGDSQRHADVHKP